MFPSSLSSIYHLQCIIVNEDPAAQPAPAPAARKRKTTKKKSAPVAPAPKTPRRSPCEPHKATPVHQISPVQEIPECTTNVESTPEAARMYSTMFKSYLTYLNHINRRTTCSSSPECCRRYLFGCFHRAG